MYRLSVINLHNRDSTYWPPHTAVDVLPWRRPRDGTGVPGARNVPPGRCGTREGKTMGHETATRERIAIVYRAGRSVSLRNICASAACEQRTSKQSGSRAPSEWGMRLQVPRTTTIRGTAARANVSLKSDER